MHNPFAVAIQWPDDARCHLVHMQRPYFTAAVRETATTTWLLVSWSPSANPADIDRRSLFQEAADFCRSHLDLSQTPIQFLERKHGHHLPRFLIAQTPARELFIVEPEHSAPLVEVRNGAARAPSKKVLLSQRFDVVTQWRLGQMRIYYQQYLERQKTLGKVPTRFATV
jgi:hypothetical protein